MLYIIRKWKRFFFFTLFSEVHYSLCCFGLVPLIQRNYSLSWESDGFPRLLILMLCVLNPPSLEPACSQRLSNFRLVFCQENGLCQIISQSASCRYVLSLYDFAKTSRLAIKNNCFLSHLFTDPVLKVC